MGTEEDLDRGSRQQQQQSGNGNRSCGQKVLKFLLDDLLLYLTILAVLLGALFGFFLRQYQPEPYTIYLLKFPGEIMLRMLKMLILPLITCSLITGQSLSNSPFPASKFPLFLQHLRRITNYLVPGSLQNPPIF